MTTRLHKIGSIFARYAMNPECKQSTANFVFRINISDDFLERTHYYEKE